MNWITREQPKIDRIACQWLILRFIDKEAKFFYVPFKEVLAKAKELNATPFDIPDVEFTHHNDQCTFDYFVKKYKIEDPAVQILARIVRAADTDRHELATEAPGLWAISSGLSFNIPNDHELLKVGIQIYDALYAWAKHLYKHKHTQSPAESLLIDVYRKFLKDKATRKRIPGWVSELRGIIQDQVDTDLSLSLQEVSKSLQVHPAYLSREFSKYFNNLTFGEYLRKLRIEKAINLLEAKKYSLAEIALITGFSDQSHFTRIFKKQTGLSPNVYRLRLIKKTN